MIEKLISQSPWHDAVHLPQAHGTVRRVKIMVQDDPAKISVEHHSICECSAIKTEWVMEWCECSQFKIMIMHLLWTHAARIEWGEKVKNVTRIGELNGNDSIYTRQKKIDMNLHFYSIVIILHGECYAEKKIMFPTNWKHEPKWMIYHMSFDSSTKPFG